MLLVLLLFFSPRYLAQRMRGKRFAPLLARLGFPLPPEPSPGKGRPLWIHAVSVGEVKALDPLIPHLRRQFPAAPFYLTTTTVTGHEEAKRSLLGKGIDHLFYLPFDLSWVVRRVVRHLSPSHFIAVEGDLWPNLLREIKRGGGMNLVVSGKISARSAKRLSYFPWLAKKLFAPIDLFSLQSEEYRSRLLPLVPDPTRLKVTGNLKFDLKAAPVVAPPPFLASFQKEGPLITISCTHPGEELLLLKALLPGPWNFLLAPRHPERFEEVKRLLKAEKIPLFTWNSPGDRRGGERVLLVDQMGVLPPCYLKSVAAVVGGSFVPGIGGHNILEPLLYQIPPFFGPFMESQKGLVDAVLEEGAGRQVRLEELLEALLDLSSLTPANFFPKRGGAALKTMQEISSL